VVCLFDDIPTKIEQQKEPPVTTLSFSCNVNFDRIAGMILEYQHYIHNQVVDLSIVNSFGDRRFHGDPISGHKLFSHVVIDATDTDSAPMHYSTNKIQITDGWVPKNHITDYQLLHILPIALNPTNLTELIDLKDLVGYGFTDERVSLVISQRLQMLKPWQSFLAITIYSVTDKEAVLPITITELGKIELLTNGDLRTRHYLVVSVLRKLDQVNWTSYRKNPVQLLNWLRWLYPYVPETILDSEDDDGTVFQCVTNPKIDRIIRCIEDRSKIHSNYNHPFYESITPAKRTHHEDYPTEEICHYLKASPQ
jgi:hypothetical protein